MTPIRVSPARAVILALIFVAGCSKTTPLTGPMDPAAERSSLSAAVPFGEASGRDEREERGFVPRSNNRYFPLVPGTTYHYRSETPDEVETQVVLVTHETRRIMGVTTRAVLDIVRLDGEVIERTTDWYAMDEDGNVWYFGEAARSFDPETGEESTEGSWLAGEDGAEPGIIMPARPGVGDAYHEENAPGVAEDEARVLSLESEVELPRRRFDDCLQTENFTALEPGVVEHKFYAPGVGLVLEVSLEEGTRNELVRVSRSRGEGDERDQDEDPWMDGVRLVRAVRQGARARLTCGGWRRVARASAPERA